MIHQYPSHDPLDPHIAAAVEAMSLAWNALETADAAPDAAEAAEAEAEGFGELPEMPLPVPLWDAQRGIWCGGVNI